MYLRAQRYRLVSRINNQVDQQLTGTGMAKAVADTMGSENQAGFATESSLVTGFSHMHDSGTGGVRHPSN